MSAATVKIILKILLMLLEDEKARKKLVTTSTGHFIVLRGITEEGRILINDPNSEKLSRKTWDINIIISESKGMWAFTGKNDSENKY